ncbi:MAG TPA: MmcQ/YjbR family DNA-binding protein [Planctomycetota bacterium]|nr:MmcQ/YjbR family DNA-binding protein [Planctomycetota bacterium]
MPRPRTPTAARMIEHLRELGLRKYPGTHLKSPWPGHMDLAVDDKTFAYLSAPDDPPGLSLKLPRSHPMALALPGSTPTAYGLGRSGWVSMSLAPDGDTGGELPPLDLLEVWLDESYRAQASKKRLRELDGAPPAAPAKRKGPAGKRPTPRRRAR